MSSSVCCRQKSPLMLAFAIIWAVFLAGAGTACGKGKDSPEKNPKGVPPATIPGKGLEAGPGKGKDPKGQVPRAESRGPEHAVYSLIDNRMSAHLQRGGGLAVNAGSAGFVKYMRFGRSKLNWKIRSERDGKKVAIMDGKTGRIDVPLTAAQASGSPTFRMRVHNEAAKALSLRINGDQKQEISQQMTAGWSTVSVTVAEGLLKEGENEILIFTGKGKPTALEWVQIGGKTSGDEAPELYDPGKKSLILPEAGGVVYYAMIPKNGRLTGDLNDPTCKAAVSVVAEGGKSAKGTLVGNGSAVDLAELSGRPARIELLGQGCKSARLGNAALVVPGEAPTMKERGEKPKYVVLWIMDSLRADRVRVFNPDARPETPTFDRLAKDSAMFLQTYVQGNESRVTHASIWSSLYPVKHNMLKPKAKLGGEWTTVDEVARSAGMYASGVTANGYVARKWGFGDSWNKYANHIHEGGGLKGQEVFDAAIATVDGKTDPWFLYIGTIDTHVSWRPKEPWIGKYHEPYTGRFAKRFSGADAGKKLNMTDAEIKWVRAVYDSNVSYQDDLLKQLLEKLESWGIAEQTMLIVTADHGDEQWEEGRVGHGGSLRDTLVHVPMLVHYPKMVPARAVSEGTEVIDIVPTIADALGVEMDKEWQGESLLPLANGVGAGYPRMSLASQYEGSHAARIGAWKLRAAGSSKPQLYNLKREPEEKTDLADKSHIARRFVADPLWLLRAYNRDWRKSQWGNAANVTAAFPAHFGE